MKYGIIFFNETKNLGDDIQTYAALKLLPKYDYVIEREKLCSFVPEKNELVTTIMSGWYVHDVTSFPPSPFINPLVISAHFTDHLLKEKPEYFDEYFLEFLKKVQPIGLRDDLVKEYLDADNIENYFSGCLTLTIKPFKNIKVQDIICAVDVDGEILEKIKKTSKCRVISETHNLNPNVNSLLSFEQRMKNVEDKLKKYQSCKLVITTRLHVALPCLSLGIPVLLIYNEVDTDIKNRLGKYTELLNFISKDNFLKKPNYNIKNKKDFLKLRKELEKKVSEFLEESSSKKLSSEEDYNYYNKYFVVQKKYIDKMIKYKNTQYEKRINEYEKCYNKLFMQNEFYEKENLIRKDNLVELVNSKQKLEAILSSRSYKLAEFLSKIIRRVKYIIKRGILCVKRK